MTNKEINLYRVTVTGFMAGDEMNVTERIVIFGAKNLCDLEQQILSFFPKSFVYTINWIDVMEEEFSIGQ